MAMENGPFVDDFLIQTSIYRRFSIAMFDYQRVIVAFLSKSWIGSIPYLQTKPHTLWCHHCHGVLENPPTERRVWIGNMTIEIVDLPMNNRWFAIVIIESLISVPSSSTPCLIAGGYVLLALHIAFRLTKMDVEHAQSCTSVSSMGFSWLFHTYVSMSLYNVVHLVRCILPTGDLT